MVDLLVVAAAGPNLLRAASVVCTARRVGLACVLVDARDMGDEGSDTEFLHELDLPTPDVSLPLRRGSEAERAAAAMTSFESELLRCAPSIVVVVGDVDSTLACALVAAKQRIPVARVGAGRRSRNRRSRQEINRRLCDQLATYLFTAGAEEADNLRREGVAGDHVVLAGDTMKDVLPGVRQAGRKRAAAARLGVGGVDYCVLALDRAGVLDNEVRLRRVFEAVAVVSRCVPTVFPLTADARDRLVASALDALLEREPGIVESPPLDYLDFVALLGGARLVLTDSPTVTEEADVLGVACLNLGDHPLAETVGIQHSAPADDTEAIVEAALTELEREPAPTTATPARHDDGRAAERIVDHLRAELFAGLPSAVGAT